MFPLNWSYSRQRLVAQWLLIMAMLVGVSLTSMAAEQYVVPVRDGFTSCSNTAETQKILKSGTSLQSTHRSSARHKTLKQLSGAVTQSQLSTSEDRLCFSRVSSTLITSTGIRPDYYLFLFRFTPF